MGLLDLCSNKKQLSPGDERGANMEIIDCMRQVDMTDERNHKAMRAVYSDACEYLKRVEEHIYKGNEIRADQWMDHSEKREILKRLDSRRTEAHDRLLTSASVFIDVLEENSDFNKSDYKLGNRTQIADFISMIAFELAGIRPDSMTEGKVRDELAEKFHLGVIDCSMIEEELRKVIPDF